VNIDSTYEQTIGGGGIILGYRNAAAGVLVTEAAA
jgi:hypothetical protein